MIVKACPLRQNPPSSAMSNNCRPDCAWYMEAEKQCVLLALVKPAEAIIGHQGLEQFLVYSRKAKSGEIQEDPRD